MSDSTRNLDRWPRGRELYQEVKRRQGGAATALLSFSRGKDSIGAWIDMAESGEFDRIVPFYGERIPGISFIEESLDYYERFFGTKIYRVPHPATFGQLEGRVYQPVERLSHIEALSLHSYEYIELQDIVIAEEELHPQTYTATGLRAADSTLRWTNFAKSGPINQKKRTFGAVWHWKKEDLINCLRKSGVKLPVDYALFGRTFDGLGGQFMVPIKKHFPEDYKRILEWFPFVEATVFRWEKVLGAAA